MQTFKGLSCWPQLDTNAEAFEGNNKQHIYTKRTKTREVFFEGGQIYGWLRTSCVQHGNFLAPRRRNFSNSSISPVFFNYMKLSFPRLRGGLAQQLPEIDILYQTWSPRTYMLLHKEYQRYGSHCSKTNLIAQGSTPFGILLYWSSGSVHPISISCRCMAVATEGFALPRPNWVRPASQCTAMTFSFPYDWYELLETSCRF